VEKSIETELEEHRKKEPNVAEEHKAEEVQHPKAPATQVDVAEVKKQLEDSGEGTEGNRQPKAELVGADTTNDEQAAREHNDLEVDTAKIEDKPKVQPSVQGVESGKQEEKLNDDHGGEELVEGQEDDVIY
jgi:hypothetical protein